jgi:hypothetical protein
MTTIPINLGQSHMTTSNLWQYPASTLNYLHATAVPSEYSEPAPISFFLKTLLKNQNLTLG